MHRNLAFFVFTTSLLLFSTVAYAETHESFFSTIQNLWKHALAKITGHDILNAGNATANQTTSCSGAPSGAFIGSDCSWCYDADKAATIYDGKSTCQDDKGTYIE